MRTIFYSTPSQFSLPTSTLNLYVRTAGKLAFPVTDLVYLQATGNYSWLYWQDGQRMLMPHCLKYYMNQLPSEWFIRLHRNCIVNLNYIERTECDPIDCNGVVYLHSGLKLAVSRRQWFAVKRLLVWHKKRAPRAAFLSI